MPEIKKNRYIGPNEKLTQKDERLVPIWPSRKSLQVRPDGSIEDPSFMSRADIIALRELLAVAKPEVSPKIYGALPSLLISEMRKDGGANTFDRNNKDSVKLYTRLIEQGASEKAAVFTTALVDAERRGKASGRDIFEAWNGNGQVRDPNTGKLLADAKNHAAKVQNNIEVFEHPQNTEIRRLLTGEITQKDLVLTRSYEDIAKAFLGLGNQPLTKPRYTDGAMVYDEKVTAPLEDNLNKKLTITERKRLKELTTENLPAIQLIQLLQEADRELYGAVTPRTPKKVIDSERQTLANKVRYIDSPEMKESPEQSNTLSSIFKGWFR